MWPLSARLTFASIGLGSGLAGAASLWRWGDPANTLHVQGAGNCFTLAIVSIAAVVGVEIATIIKGAK